MTNQFIGGFKMFYTQLIKDPLNILDLTIYFEENCLNHQGKETTSRLKSTSQHQRGLGKKMKRYWKLLQKEEAKLNNEKTDLVC